MRFVLDTNVLMDMTKPDGAADVPVADLTGARLLLSHLLEETCADDVAYSKGMLSEWTEKRLLEKDVAYTALRQLAECKRLVCVEAVKVSGGRRSDFAKHVDRDDQVFVLTAAALARSSGRRCVTHDPKTTTVSARRYVARHWRVAVRRASEFADELALK